MRFPPKTVLILGAGASNPYGFPLGDELKNRILETLSQPGMPEWSLFIDAGFTEGQIRDFADSLAATYLYRTIDQYLEDRPSHRKIGAFAIAQVINEREDESIWRGQRNWYDKLAQALNLREEQPSELLGIITFNYERSLQHFLQWTALHHFEGAPRERALKKVHSIPIVHVHGSFGNLAEVPFRPFETAGVLLKAAESLRLVHDSELVESMLFAQARAMLGDAEQIIVLGWGFDHRGIERLRLKDFKYGTKEKRIVATAMGLPNRAGIFDLFNKQIALEEVDANQLMQQMLKG